MASSDPDRYWAEAAANNAGARLAEGPFLPLPKGRWSIPVAGRMSRCLMPDLVITQFYSAKRKRWMWKEDREAVKPPEGRTYDPLGGV